MNKKLIFAVLALGLLVPGGGKALAGTISSDLVIIQFLGQQDIFFPENAPSQFRPAFAPAPGFTGAVQLLENASTAVVSDQLWIQAGFFYFASDPDLQNLDALNIPITGTITEDGTLQNLDQYFHDARGLLLPLVQVQSDLDPAVPEPATLALLATGALPLLVARRLRSRRLRLRAARVF